VAQGAARSTCAAAQTKCSAASRVMKSLSMALFYKCVRRW
jgi:hypothetical protein